MAFGGWALLIASVGAVVLVVRGVVNRTRTADFDAGGVSQSWLTEHKAGKGERFS